MTKNFIPREPKSALETENISFAQLLTLQELGILSGVESIGLSMTFQSVTEDKFLQFIQCHDMGLLVEHADPSHTLGFKAYCVTTLGVQVIKLGRFQASANFLKAVGADLRKKGYKVWLVTKTERKNDGFVIKEQEEIE